MLCVRCWDWIYLSSEQESSWRYDAHCSVIIYDAWFWFLKGNSNKFFFLQYISLLSALSVSIPCLTSPSLSSTGPLRSLAALDQSPVTLPCSNINGDYVLLYWWRPDSPHAQPQLIFQFDRWRDSRKHSNLRLQVQSRHPPGNFSFLLRPEVRDSGRYQCEVFRDDQVFAQVTVLSVLKGNETR